jgi:hypothetical protein
LAWKTKSFCVKDCSSGEAGHGKRSAIVLARSAGAGANSGTAESLTGVQFFGKVFIFKTDKKNPAANCTPDTP